VLGRAISRSSIGHDRRGQACNSRARTCDRPRPPGRPPARPKGEDARKLQQLSVTVLQEKKDIPAAAYEALVVWLRDACVAGSLTTERGETCFHLHVQDRKQSCSHSTLPLLFA